MRAYLPAGQGAKISEHLLIFPGSIGKIEVFEEKSEESQIRACQVAFET
jgi:hypothetical protein